MTRAPTSRSPPPWPVRAPIPSGAVGSDCHAEIVLGQLVECGVGFDRVAHTGGATGVPFISDNALTENSIAVIFGANTAVDSSAGNAAGDLSGILVLQRDRGFGLSNGVRCGP